MLTSDLPLWLRSCEEIPERAKPSRAETRRCRGEKENKAVTYSVSLRLCVSARDGRFFHSFYVVGMDHMDSRIAGKIRAVEG
jgi:hypothetical protein